MKNRESGNIVQKPLTPTMEDYLEAIFNLSKENDVVRVKDIASRLKIKMPTVTNMLKTLTKRKLIDYEKYEYLELTDGGADVGREICRKHHVLRSFLIDILNVEPDRADKEACKMEHAVSTSTLNKFVEFMEFIQFCPRTGANWFDRFEEYRLHGRGGEKCMDHMKEFAKRFKDKIECMGEMEDKKNGA